MLCACAYLMNQSENNKKTRVLINQSNLRKFEFFIQKLSCFVLHKGCCAIQNYYLEQLLRLVNPNRIFKMKILIFIASCILAVNAVSFFDLVLEEWQLFKIQHNKTYPNDTEEKFRMKIFMDNKHKVNKHNTMYEQGKVTYKLGLNKYSDMLHHEFIHTLNGFNKSSAHLKQVNSLARRKKGSFYISPAHVELPDHVNWVRKGAVTPVKDQGHCGSCWAFSTTGSLEAQHFRKTGVLVSLSEQNLIDCSTPEGNNGCSGGLMDLAFQYVEENGGIDTERSYPYEGENDKCRYSAKNSGATDTGYVDIPSGDEEALKSAVATIGPVSVAIDASHESFQLYSSGVYVEPNCKNGNEDLDHGVLVVGYGRDEDSQQDYWLVKNSWGESWGEDGYIKMARNADNQCGIATTASYPLV